MKRRWLAVGIILLFIGVAVAPSINFTVVKASNDNDLVEVTTQACGIKGFGNTTVKLTKQQYQNLEQYLVDFRARLNQTTTREEAVPIFKEAVVELNKYGLLPKGMNVEQAQKLVSGGYQKLNEIQVLGKEFKKKILDNFSNKLCLILGFSNNTEIWSTLSQVWWLVLILINNYLNNLPDIQRAFIGIIWLVILEGIFLFDLIRPLLLWSKINISQGNGYLFTIGLNGIKKWSGLLEGGAIGFTGIKILLDFKEINKYFYFGSALNVQIDYA
jgi:hypothetical protein